ncbi:MAG TPA: saccharopine dehydrogenase C-terminal domain-containing protein, partial [Chitinivibrionales bacterium]|nr:saccharopine dehydrogenase C-terminal domain-containing protein [Chitinivibrionales bacterium]
KYFATNFDPEINFREFIKVWTWIDRKWVCKPIHDEKMVYTFPVVGKQTVYLNGHDELHLLSKNIDANSIRFWMGFSDHYINVFTVLKNIGLLSHQPVTTAEGLVTVPLKVVKACLPDPSTLAQVYTGKTCIGNLTRGKKDGKEKEIFIYNICDHKKCYEEVESQAISYTAGVPVAAAAMLVANGTWNPKTMVNVEELDPDPFIGLLDNMGLPTEIKYIKPPRAAGTREKPEVIPKTMAKVKAKAKAG